MASFSRNRSRDDSVSHLFYQGGPAEADGLTRTTPGMAFTNDLIEEFSDEVECYRSYLVTLAKRLRTTAPRTAG